MTIRQERYLVVIDFPIDAFPIGDDSFIGRPIRLTTDRDEMTVTVGSMSVGFMPGKLSTIRGDMTVTVGCTPENQSTIEVRWEFDDWYTEDSRQDFPESRLEMCRRLGTLFVPSEAGDFMDDRAITGETLIDAARSYFAWLALASRSPNFATRLHPPDLSNAKMFAEVVGSRFEIKPHCYWGVPALRLSPIAIARARDMASAPFPRYANFLLTADRRRMDGAIADAVIHLAQGLEIAAYDYVRKPPIALHRWQFRPPECFGPQQHRQPRVWTHNCVPLGQYQSVCELFGARHEWIHEGRAKVRAFDPTNAISGIDKTKLRDLTVADYCTFRSAVSSALQWMGELPIE